MKLPSEDRNFSLLDFYRSVNRFFASAPGSRGRLAPANEALKDLGTLAGMRNIGPTDVAVKPFSKYLQLID
jgi:hypothetical protein